MIADCSLNAKVAMLHGILTEYLAPLGDDEPPLPINLAWDIDSAMPACYPRKNVLTVEVLAFVGGHDSTEGIIDELAAFLESEHCMCDYQTCRKDQP